MEKDTAITKNSVQGWRWVARVVFPLVFVWPLFSASAQQRFSVVEASIPDIQRALASGTLTSRELVMQYLARIATYENRLNATVAVNPRALEIADQRDRERASGQALGSLHGIPVAVKDIFHTSDMPTTGGALAFSGFFAPYESTVVANLKAEGAIILAKTQLSELANWVAGNMPANYTGLTGYGMNPWDPRLDPRPGLSDGRPVQTTGGSSSGVGTSVSFWAASVGTETSGSILSPSNATMLVGVKPTVGRLSRHGVIPITADRDTPGPMARNVTDAAIMLGAMEGQTADPYDKATGRCDAVENADYTAFLDAGALAGARIGIPRAYYYDATDAGDGLRGGLTHGEAAAMLDAIAILKSQGAVIIDPADIPSIVAVDPQENYLNWALCSGENGFRGRDANCSMVLKYGMKRDFNAWLKSVDGINGIETLTDLRRWNIEHQRAGSIKYGQSQLDISDEIDLVRDEHRYQSDLRKDQRLAAENGIDAVLQKHNLDAVLFPGSNGRNIAARAAYPTVAVPFALVSRSGEPGFDAFPAGFNPLPVPFGVSFSGSACSEPRLLALAFAFEQASLRRVPPPLFP